ncbi:hypothetical protein [Streptomyces sp. NBC_01462]|uniref:hypothetical protein n=1 Tax=Streptomyces sp. NBC_01462 TaxID=2903876 RepID=UPI00324A27A5
MLVGEVEVLTGPVNDAVRLDRIAAYQGEPAGASGGERVEEKAATVVGQAGQGHAAAAGLN